MARFSRPMERRLNVLEREYDVAPQEQEEEGYFGKRGFLGNIRDFYQTDSWGDWWRGIFGRQQEERRGEEELFTPVREQREVQEKEEYYLSPFWKKEGIRQMIDLMESTR